MSDGFPIKINVPQYSITVPSLKKKYSFRPFLVGEQKSMMLASATNDIDTVCESIKSLINVCSNNKIDAHTLAPFDLEYLFLQLRAKSIGETVPLGINCVHCGGEIDFSVDISKADVDVSNMPDTKITLIDKIGVIMRFPTLEENLKLHEKDEINEEVLFDTTIDCITSVWNETDFVNTKDYSKEKLLEFINTLSVSQFKKMSDFILATPSVKIVEKVKCNHCNKENTVLLEGLENFFD